MATIIESAHIGAQPDAGGGRRRRRPTQKLVVGLVICGLIVAFGIAGPWFVADPQLVDNIGMKPPSADHWLGTTQTGQDVFAQLAHATRGSLIIGLLVGVLAIGAAALVGVVGAYAGGWLDETLSLVSNVMLVIPGLPLVIVISSYVPEKGILLVAAVLALTGWAGCAIVLRATTLSVRSRDYVLAARVSGERTWRILLVEILPNLVPVLVSLFIFSMIGAILGEAGLAFLGLGANGSWTWGSMLFWAGNGLALRLGALWWFVPPGLMVALFGAGLALVNFSIDEITDPRLRAHGARRRGRHANGSARSNAVGVAVGAPEELR